MSLRNILYGLVIMGFILSCKQHKEEYHDLNEKIEEESKHYHDPGISSEAFMGDIKTLEIKEGDHSFFIPERKSQIRSYACIECHTKPLTEMQSGSEVRAHWDIEMNHADESTMNCVICHNGTDMNNLNSLVGKSIDFNLSYKLCAQCHTAQFNDWKGGAHGKNIGGWAKPRAAMTCVNCHNPHKPQIASKWPVRFNTQKEKERE